MGPGFRRDDGKRPPVQFDDVLPSGLTTILPTMYEWIEQKY